MLVFIKQYVIAAGLVDGRYILKAYRAEWNLLHFTQIYYNRYLYRHFLSNCDFALIFIFKNTKESSCYWSMYKEAYKPDWYFYKMLLKKLQGR